MIESNDDLMALYRLHREWFVDLCGAGAGGGVCFVVTNTLYIILCVSSAEAVRLPCRHGLLHAFARHHHAYGGGDTAHDHLQALSY